MLWNSFLALVPAIAILFVQGRHRRTLVALSALAALCLYPFVSRIVSILSHSAMLLPPSSLIAITALGLVLTAALLIPSAFRQRIRVAAAMVLFLTFLPNAPYVLTDIIHLFEAIRANAPETVVIVALIPLYVLFMLVGFGAYVVSLHSVDSLLKQAGWKRYSRLVEWSLHFASAFGVYLGRFIRFNSWDLATNPESVLQTSLSLSSSRAALSIILISALIIALLYKIYRRVGIALIRDIRTTSWMTGLSSFVNRLQGTGV